MAMLVGGDWMHARKYFSLSEKYANWKDFTTPARGIGLHAVVVAENESLRLTQEEIEAHPEWRGFAESAGKHPPLRGLLAVPIVGETGSTTASSRCRTRRTAAISTRLTNAACNVWRMPPPSGLTR
jgi:GAF domain-containing protein